jgi:hypothetical protein
MKGKSSSSSKNSKVKQKKSNNRSSKKSNIRRIGDNGRKKKNNNNNNARLAIRLSAPRRQQRKQQQSYGKSSKSLKKKEEQQQQPQQLFIRRSSGRKEKFDTNRMAQTVSRSGVPFLMARDVAKKVSSKIRNETNNNAQQIKKRKHNAGGSKVVSQTKLKREKEKQKEKSVTAGRIRNLVANELRDRNRSDIAASYTGQMPENTLQEQNLKDKQPIEDTVAANKNRVLHDTSKRGGGIMT